MRPVTQRSVLVAAGSMILPVFVLCSMLCLCAFAAAGENPVGLDPETREDLRRSIDQRHPNLDPATKAAILRRIEKTPKLRCSIEAVTICSDGIVCRATLSSDLPFDCRVSDLGRCLSPVCSARLTDSDKNEWRVPPLKSHYLFAHLEETWTVLIPRGKSVCITHVDQLESPRPVRLRPPAEGKTVRPQEFRYTILGYGTAYTKDLRKQESVYWIGRGKTPVTWKDEPVPSEKKTRVVQEQGARPWSEQPPRILRNRQHQAPCQRASRF